MTDTIQEQLRRWARGEWVLITDQDLVLEAADEIDRLNDEVSARDETINEQADIINGLERELAEAKRGMFKPDHPTIEERRLMEDAGALNDALAEEHDLRMKAERELAEAKERAWTDEQIDRAWRCFGAIRGHACCRATLKAALYELGIVACDECGGVGVGVSEHCTNCSGHGWVMEGDDV